MLDRQIHKSIILQILKDIYTKATLGPILGFKGGTAAHLFYDLGRFSIDLDFDLLIDEKETIVFDAVEKILRGYGSIRDKYIKRHTILFVLSYEDQAPNIKVEINRRNFESRYSVRNYLGVSMLVMERADMFAHKLVALLERQQTAHRDVYDIWYFLKNRWPINKSIVEKRTKMDFTLYLEKCIEFVESLRARSILSGLGELIDEKQKTWVKHNLRSDTVFLLKLLLEHEA